MTTGTWILDITRAECESLLAQTPLGRLGVIIDGRPEIFPVNHVFDRETGRVTFPTNAMTKLHAALNWPFVAFEIDAMDPPDASGWSVLVVGRAEEITDVDDVARLSAQRTAVWRTGDRVHWISIVPEKVTGRRIFGPRSAVRS